MNGLLKSIAGLNGWNAKIAFILLFWDGKIHFCLKYVNALQDKSKNFLRKTFTFFYGKTFETGIIGRTLGWGYLWTEATAIFFVLISASLWLDGFKMKKKILRVWNKKR